MIRGARLYLAAHAYTLLWRLLPEDCKMATVRELRAFGLIMCEICEAKPAKPPGEDSTK